MIAQFITALVTVLLAMVWIPTVQHTAPAAPSAAQAAMPAVSSPVLQAINNTRIEKGLNSLIEAPTLNASAAAKCAYMVANNYWAHDGGDRSWDSFFTEYNHRGEILAKGFDGDLAAQHQAWLGSPTHYKQITNDFDYFGVATCAYTNGEDLTVVHFGGAS